ncbi:MAG: hypothetical protein ACRDQ5_15005 [Sciscionella sp.]
MTTRDGRDQPPGDGAFQPDAHPSRRGFLGWVGKTGMAVVGGLAAATATAKTAYAAVAPQANWECCDLAFGRPTCPNNDCPSGTYAYAWTCCAGSPPFERTFICGECTTNSHGNCDTGPFVCSYGFTSNPNGCTPSAVKASTWRPGVRAGARA